MIDSDFLVVIEAPGKAATTYRIIEKIVETDFQVFSTRGRLFDIPSDVLGVSIEDGKYLARLSPVKPKVIERLSSLAKKFNCAVILTDADIEGEVIGSHAAQVLMDSNSEIKIYRARINNLDLQEINNAFRKLGEIDYKKAKAGEDRRIIDRIIGYRGKTNQPKSSGTIGRVLTPSLESILKHGDKYSVGRINLACSNKDEDYILRFEINRNHLRNIAEIEHELNKSEVKIEIYGEAKERVIASPWNYSSALKNISRVTDEGVLSVAGALQDLYENGVISYPRTVSNKLSSDCISVLSSFAKRQGLYSFSKERISWPSTDEEEGLNCGHYGIMVNKSYLNLDYESSMNLRESCVALITENLVNSGLVNSLMTYESKIVNQPRIIDLIQKYKLKYKTIKKKQKNNLNTYRQTADLMGVKEQRRNIDVKVYHKSNYVLDILSDKKLGRPSTLPYFSNVISSRYLDETYMLNGLAVNSLNKAQKVIPGLNLENSLSDLDESLYSLDESLGENHINKILSSIGITDTKTDVLGKNIEKHYSI